MKKYIIPFILLLCLCLQTFGFDETLRTASDGFQFYYFEEDSYIGVKDKNGNIIIPAYYDNLEYHDGLFIVKNRSRKYSIYMNTGEVLLPSTNVISVWYDKNIKHSPLILMTDRQTWRAMSWDGKILVPEDYYGYLRLKKDTISNEYYFGVGINGYHGIVDSAGTVIIPPTKYNRLSRINDGKSCYYKFVVYNSECNYSGICDKSGKEVIRTPFIDTTPASDEKGNLIYKVNLCNRTGYLDSKGNPIKMPKDTSDVSFKGYINGEEYETVFTCRGKLGLKKGGKLIIPKEYDYLKDTKNYIEVIKGTYWGAYDFNGNCIVPPNFYEVIADWEDHIYVQKGNKHTFLDFKGHELFPLKYPTVVRLKEDGFVAWGATDEETGLIALFNKDAQQLTPFVYDECGLVKDASTNTVVGFCVFRNGRVGFCDLKGNETIEVAYTDMELLSEKGKRVIKTINGNKCGACKLDGTILIPAEIFDNITLEKKKIVAYAPNRKCVFTLDGKLLSDTQPNTERDKYVGLADAEFEKEHWSKAANYYGKAIEQVPSAALYYNKAVSHYNNKSYKQAIKDFNNCLASDPSQKLIDKSKALIARSQQLQAEKVERRQAILANIVGLAVGVATAYMGYQLQSSGRGGAYGSGGYQKRENVDYLLDPNYAIQQVQIENWREYMWATNGGKTMSYEEWMALKAQAYANAQNVGGGLSTSDSNSSSSRSSTYSSSASNNGSMCRICAGMKWCQTCEGKGYYYSSFDLSKKLPCPNCYDHNGKCSACNGTGVR